MKISESPLLGADYRELSGCVKPCLYLLSPGRFGGNSELGFLACPCPPPARGRAVEQPRGVPSYPRHVRGQTAWLNTAMTSWLEERKHQYPLETSSW